MNMLQGTGVALVTPFLKSGKIDFASLEKLLVHTAKGVDYYVVMGTTGESATLSKDEKKEILTFVKANNKKKLPIVYGVGGNNTAEVIKQIADTDWQGVAAMLSVSPYYNKPSQAGIIAHFEALAKVAPVPIVLYNVPGRTGSNLTAATTVALSKNKKIIGVKEASGNLEQCLAISKGKQNGFMLISGDDLLTTPMMAIGGEGVISVLANAFPEIFKAITKAAFKKDFAQSTSETHKLLGINSLMYEEGNPAGIKYVLELLGVCQRFTRLPVVPPSTGLQKRIKAALASM